MRTIKTVFGYLWAGLGIPVILIVFMCPDFWIEKLVVTPGFKVAAWAEGGEIVQTLNHDTYQTQIHRPVFDGLLWDKRTGFVQIDWTSDQPLPDQIDETIDLDRDGRLDVQIVLNTRTNTAALTPIDPRVVSLSHEGVLVFEHARTVRIVLKKAH